MKEIAEAQGYNVSSLQQRANVTYPTLYAIWNNQTRNPEFATLLKIANALNVATADLIEEEEDGTDFLAAS